MARESDRTPARPERRASPESPRRAIATKASLINLARSGVRAAAMGAWTLALMPVAVPHMRSRPPSTHERWRRRWVGTWAAGLTRVFGVDLRVRGEQLKAPVRGRLVVANHRSPLDIIILLERFGGTVLSRADLRTWPVLGAAAYHGGTIFVDRADERSGVKAIREIRRRLQAGQTVIVFPEGTTHRGDEVRPFVGGAFAAVRGLDAELVPVGLAYDEGAEFFDETFGEHVARVAQRKTTRVGLCVGAPRSAAADRDAMALEMRAAIQALVHQARDAMRD
jgi:1-acyl-sn-glycerol-3-phosphate acyltransferase